MYVKADLANTFDALKEERKYDDKTDIKRRTKPLLTKIVNKVSEVSENLPEKEDAIFLNGY